MAEQGTMAAALQIQQPDQLLPDVIGNGIGRPGVLVSDRSGGSAPALQGPAGRYLFQRRDA
jgi:hypothetical protein